MTTFEIPVSRYKAIKGGMLIDGNGKDPIHNAAILICGDRIEKVGMSDEVTIPLETPTIDATGMTIMPGMCDMHVHLYWNGEPNLALHTWQESTAFRAVKSVAYIQRSMQAGFTTLRSCGALGYLDVALRDAVDQGIIWGPRVVACGYSISGTGGHADKYPPWLYRTDEVSPLADGVSACIRAVREQIKMNVNWIKFHASGGIMDPFSDPHAQEYSDKEMNAIVSEAHARGKFTAAHAQGAQGIRAAVKAGVDTIEHGVYIEDDVIEAMLKQGTFVVPTWSATHRMLEAGQKSGMPPESLAKLKTLAVEARMKSFKKALAAGVGICMGTDAGSPYNYHGDNAFELTLMVKNGMTEMEAIISCTKRASQALRMNDKIGTIEAHKYADILLVNGNPLKDIHVLADRSNIKLVMKQGAVCVDCT